MDAVEKYFRKDVKSSDWADVTMQLYDSNISTHTSSYGPEVECKVFKIDMSSQFNTDYQVRFVYTPDARLQSELGRFHRYVDKTVRSYVNFNDGYCRWMDEHLGISLQAQTSGQTKAVSNLDDIRANLEEAHVPYHAHFTEYVNGTREGSIWAWGVSGIGIEWHGALTMESFGAMDNVLGNFDFCQSDSTCTEKDEMCYVNTTTWGVQGGASRR